MKIIYVVNQFANDQNDANENQFLIEQIIYKLIDKPRIMSVYKNDQVDKIVDSVFKTVRANKINSFIQLKNFHCSKSLPQSYIFQPSRKLSYHGQQDNYNPKDIDKKYIKSLTQSLKPIIVEDRLFQNPEFETNNFIHFDEQTKQKMSQSHKPKRKQSLNLNCNTTGFSKIKKHLVSKIDYDDIESKLNTNKLNSTTRYEHFMQKLNKKNRGQMKNNNFINFNNKTFYSTKSYNSARKSTRSKNDCGMYQTTIKWDTIQSPRPQTLQLRTNHRVKKSKKFWVKDLTFNKNQKSSPRYEINCIQVRKIQTIQL